MKDSEQRRPQFGATPCFVLKYRRPGLALESSAAAVLLLVVHRGAELSFFLSRQIDGQVSAADSRYLRELIPDLTERARKEPDAVFKQLQQLGVGPLVADEPVMEEVSEEVIRQHYPELEPLA